jgi:hypothetical protein
MFDETYPLNEELALLVFVVITDQEIHPDLLVKKAMVFCFIFRKSRVLFPALKPAIMKFCTVFPPDNCQKRTIM